MTVYSFFASIKFHLSAASAMEQTFETDRLHKQMSWIQAWGAMGKPATAAAD